MTTRADVLRYLDALRTVIDGAGDEAKYPDGVLGAVFAAMLAIERETCPDAGDFAHVV